MLGQDLGLLKKLKKAIAICLNVKPWVTDIEGTAGFVAPKQRQRR